MNAAAETFASTEDRVDSPEDVRASDAHRQESETARHEREKLQALVAIVTNKELLETIGGVISGVVDGIAATRRAERAVERRRHREESARHALLVASSRRAMCLHFLLATFALGAIVWLRLQERLTDSAAAPLLAGVVGSLFVQPRRQE